MNSSHFTQHSNADFQTLLDVGVPKESINQFEVLSIDEYILKEYYSNRLFNGFEVPEEYVYDGKPQKEKELNYRELLSYKEESKRNKEPEMFADPYSRLYDDDELEYDERIQHSDWVPEHVYNSRRERERQENRAILRARTGAKKAKNKELSRKLLEMQRKNGVEA